VTDEQVLVVGSRGSSRLDAIPGVQVESAEALVAAYGRTAAGRVARVWVAERAADLMPLVRLAPRLGADQRLLVLEPPDAIEWSCLNLLFRVIVEGASVSALLQTEELGEAMTAANRADLFVAGVVNAPAQVVVLYRGTLDPVVVPFGWFTRASADAPDFTAFALADYGQTVRFGAYEASADAVLYDLDAEYRKRAKARELAHDDSFGACVRRLRLSKGVRRSDFPGITEKEVARIERGEVKRPHRATIEAIAARLGVDPAEITSY
jgi:hypothetical protein